VKAQLHCASAVLVLAVALQMACWLRSPKAPWRASHWRPIPWDAVLVLAVALQAAWEAAWDLEAERRRHHREEAALQAAGGHAWGHQREEAALQAAWHQREPLKGMGGSCVILHRTFFWSW